MSEQPSDERTPNNRDKAASADYRPNYTRADRRPAEDRANAFNTLAWLLEGATGLAEELRHSDLGLSEEFWVHFYAMRREGLLAARAAIDSLLTETEQAEQKAQEKETRQSRRGGVSVDFK